MGDDVRLCSTREISIDALADLFTRSFEGYFMPLTLDARAMATFVRRDGVDLYLSQWADAGGRPAGLMLISVRGAIWRIAAMGVVAAERRTGVGRTLVRHAIDAARTAGARRLELEVIDRNAAAIALYESCGLRRTQRLLGFEWKPPAGEAAAPGANEAPDRADAGAELIPCDALEVASAIQRFGDADLPWQLSAENIAGFVPPAQGFRVGQLAWCLTTDPSQATVSVFSLVVSPQARRRGLARSVLAALRQRFAGKSWRVSPLVPEGPPSQVMQRLGWTHSELGQWRMVVDL